MNVENEQEGLDDGKTIASGRFVVGTDRRAFE